MAAAAGLARWVLGNAFAPTEFASGPPSVPNPVGVGGLAGSVFKVVLGRALLILATGVAAIVSLVLRYRHAPTVEREQLKWLVYGSWRRFITGVYIAIVVGLARVSGIV
jgi:hypothetical protein